MHPDVVDQNPSVIQFLFWKLGKALSKKKATAHARTRTQFQSIIRLMLQVGGFCLLTIAGFTWHIIAGYVIAGLSCFLLSWLTTSEPNSSQNSNGPGYQR